jgi:hypothetical protein
MTSTMQATAHGATIDGKVFPVKSRYPPPASEKQTANFFQPAVYSLQFLELFLLCFSTSSATQSYERQKLNLQPNKQGVDP